MRALVLMSTFVTTAELAVLAGALGQSVAAGKFPSTVPAPDADATTRARLDGLYQQLEDLKRQYGFESQGWRASGQGEAPKDEAAQKRADAQKRMGEIRTEISTLTLGPDLTAKYEEYERKVQELSRQYTDAYNDKGLDKDARQARIAEIQKQQQALHAEYGDAVRKRLALEMEGYQRQYRRHSLEQGRLLLKCTDDEWKVLRLRLEDVMKLQDDVRAARIAVVAVTGPRFSGSTWQNHKSGTPDGDLIGILKSEDAAVAGVKSRLDALRRARGDEDAKRTAELVDLTKRLKAAQDALRELLSVRQEAVLVVERILD